MPPLGLHFGLDNNPLRAISLFDWLDGHPEERDIIFNVTVPIRGETLTQGACYARAALHLCSTDDDDGTIARRLHGQGFYDNLEGALAHLRKLLAQNVPGIDRRLIDIFMPFSMQIKYHIHGRCKKAYQDFNNKIMESRPAIKLDNVLGLEDIEFKPRVGKFAGIAETESLSPKYIWNRLHKYWRNNPTYNQYLRANLARSCGTRRHTASRGISADCDKMSTLGSDSEASEFQPEAEIQLSASVKQKNSHKTRRVSAPRGQSDYRMLELKIQLKQLENEGLKMQTSAELQRLKLQADMEERKRKHELRIQLLGSEIFKEV